MDGVKHDDKIVMYGMPGIGKTFYANKLRYHEYYCFDDMLNRDGIEILGLSISANLKAIAKKCVADKYVLDGWHLADRDGLYLPEGCTLYVIFMEYARLAQFSIPFKRWYSLTPKVKKIRYWENVGAFIERSADGYQAFLKRYQHTEATFEIQGNL